MSRTAGKGEVKGNPGTGRFRPVRRHGRVKAPDLAHRMAERVKELNCLYGISQLRERPNISTEEILQGVVDLIPAAWQYPEVTCARISLRSGQYQTANCMDTPWKQIETITVNRRQVGVLEVRYIAEKPAADEGPFLNEERKLIHAIAERVGHIIEHRLAESRLRSLYRREKQARTKLQAEMSHRVDYTRKLIHELKTPLTSLLATSQLLLDEAKGTKLERIARPVWEGAVNLDHRIEELHDVTRGEIGRLRLDLKKVKLGELIAALRDETRALARARGMTVDVQADADLPEVEADPDRIRQVLLNLVNNAFEYARSGKKVQIRASAQPGSVVVEVRDFGPGVNRERRRALFEPLHRHSDQGENSGGLGIGLVLCKMLVELQGGRLWLRSWAGRGASFLFSLPTVRKEQ